MGRSNPTEKGLYGRIDFMQFSDMKPYMWGFCLFIYDAADTTIAMKAASAGRQNPRKGCNGFPFSRMKRVEYLYSASVWAKGTIISA